MEQNGKGGKERSAIKFLGIEAKSRLELALRDALDRVKDIEIQYIVN